MTFNSSALIENALAVVTNRLLASDADALVLLERLDGRVIAIHFRDREFRVFATINAGKVSYSKEADQPADVSMYGGAADFLTLIRANKGGRSLRAGRIEISGDLAVAQDVQALLDGLEIDFEEMISFWVGDVAAHQIGRAVRGAGDVASDVLGRFEKDVVDYLSYELVAIPQREEVAVLQQEIDALAQAVERAEERVARLRAQARAQ
jgi:ubiquinone biosynthesis accessory factor UbiJ